MKKIPDIAFESSDSNVDIEFLNLKELFARIQKAPNHDPKKPHRIKFNALLIVTEGNGYHQIDLKTYPIKKGDILKIANGQVHAFQGDLNYEGVLIVFTEDYVFKYFSQSSRDIISHFYNYYITDPLVSNCTFNSAFLEEVSKELKEEFSVTQQNIIAKMLELYLLKLERLATKSNRTNHNIKYYDLFLMFQQLVHENYTKSRNVKDFADRMSISTKHLNTVVQSITFESAKTFIDQFVILEIKRSIQSTDLSLKEIAFEKGFDEVTNFSKYFKKLTGSTPKEYKSQL